MPIVIDASVTIAWCFDDEATPLADGVLDRLRDQEAFVPALWQLEVANVLLIAEGRGRITEAQATRFLDLLMQLPIRIDQSFTNVAALLAAGRRHRLTVYDAAYLLLAERIGAPLATLESNLIAAARTAGVELATAD